MFLAITQLYKLFQRKFWGFSRSPFRAEFENVPNFISSYKIVQDIAETVKWLQIIRLNQIYIELFLFWHLECFFNISGSLEARNKIKDAVLISMDRAVGKSK